MKPLLTKNKKRMSNNLETTIESLKRNYGFRVSLDAPFWNKTKNSFILGHKEELMVFSIYLLAYFNFKDWGVLMTQKDKSEAFLQKYRELNNAGKNSVTEDELKQGLDFIAKLSPVIQKHSFVNLKDEYLPQLRSSLNSQYSFDGHVERGASKPMTKYNNY